MIKDQLNTNEQELDLLLSILTDFAQGLHELNEDLETQFNTW